MEKTMSLAYVGSHIEKISQTKYIVEAFQSVGTENRSQS